MGNPRNKETDMRKYLLMVGFLSVPAVAWASSTLASAVGCCPFCS